MATKTIGTGGDYSTYASYLTYLQTLGTLSAPEVGKQKNEEITLSSPIDFSGFTPTSTNTWTLEAEAGASFRDNANKATNALRYNASNGAAITTAYNYNQIIAISVPFATMRNLQIRSTGFAAPFVSTFDVGNVTFDNMIVEAVGWNGARTVTLGGNGDKLRNSIIVLKSSVTQTPIAVQRNGQVRFCTIVRPSNFTTGSNMCESNYGTATFDSCVWIGFNNTMLGGGSLTGSNNATDQASFPTGLSGQTGLTPATEFEQPSNASSAMDWRLKSTSVKCAEKGSTDSTNGAADIIGTTRPQGTLYDVGCWELAAAGGGAFTLTASGVAFTLTGKAASLRRAATLTFGRGTFTESGKAAALRKGSKVTAANAAFTHAGKAAALRKTSNISAAKAAFTYTGNAVALSKGFRLSAAPSGFSLNGQPVALSAARKLAASKNAFVLTGQNATLIKVGGGQFTLAADVGAFTLAGKAAALRATRQLAIGSGTFALTGRDAGLSYVIRFLAAAGVFTLEGRDAALYAVKQLVAMPGTFTFDGKDIRFIAGEQFNFPDTEVVVAPWAQRTIIVALEPRTVYAQQRNTPFVTDEDRTIIAPNRRSN